MRRADGLSIFHLNPGELRDPPTSAHLPGTAPGPHSGVGPGGIGKAESAKASSMLLMLFLMLAPPCSTVEITGHQVHLFRQASLHES